MDTVKENKSSIKDQILKEKKFNNAEFIAAIIFNIVFLYIVNNLLNWNISFIAPTFTQVLLIVNVSIIANILANIAFLIYQRGWFRSVVQIILNTIGFAVAYNLYMVFPFIFKSTGFAFAIKLALILVMVVLVIASFIEVLRLILVNILKINS